MDKKEGTAVLVDYTGVTNVDNQTITEHQKLKENFERAKDSIENNICPVRDIFQRISDKWSLLAILALGVHGTMRFGSIKNEIGDVSQRMLTVTLRNLEHDGFVTRTVYAVVPPKVEYQLTPLGVSLMNQVRVMTAWIEKNSDEIMAARKPARLQNSGAAVTSAASL